MAVTVTKRPDQSHSSKFQKLPFIDGQLHSCGPQAGREWRKSVAQESGRPCDKDSGTEHMPKAAPQ